MCVYKSRYYRCRGVREEKLLRKEGGGGGRGWCLRAENWRSTQHPGRPPDFMKGQIGGFVLHKLCHGFRPYGFRPYDFF